MSVIKPTVGRMVHYWPSSTDTQVMGMASGNTQPLAGQIAHVWSDTCVNISIIDANGRQHGKTSVFLHQGDGPKPDVGFCEWMEYQKGQAQKTEQVEAELKKVAKPVAAKKKDD